MRNQLATGTLLLALVAFTANIPGEPKGPTTGEAGTAPQEHAKRSRKTSPNASGRKLPCKTPENASLCYWTHGRLAIANGNPSLRMWRIGTHRMLGVFSGPSHFPPRTVADDESPDLPVNLERAYEADHRRWKKSGVRYYEFPVIFADFEVCPLEPEKKDEMQAVCVESARNVFLQKSY